MSVLIGFPTISRRIRSKLLCIALAAPFVVVTGAKPARADSAGALRTPLLAGAIDDSTRVQIDAPDRTRLRFSKDLGPVDSSTTFDRLQIVLRRPAGAQAAFSRLLRAQQNPASPTFHHWLTPDTVGAEYGPADADMRILSQWLEAHGLRVNTTARSMMSIDVSATAADLRSAFGADMHQLRHGPELHLANVAPVSIPAALAPLVVGVIGLDDFHAVSYVAPLHAPPARAFAARTETTGYDLVGPQDFATIYNLRPLWQQGIQGAGKTIAIVGRSEIYQSDVNAFDSHFGIHRAPVNNIMHNAQTCGDPGRPAGLFDAGYGDEIEASIDVEWSGAVAPSATILNVACQSTRTTDGVLLASRVAVDYDPDIISVSFGLCEQYGGPATIAYYSSLWQQAAAQGVTVVVASGDSGAASCNGLGDFVDATQAPGVNLIAATPYDTAVGGTDFQDRVLHNKGPLVRDQAYWKNVSGAGGETAKSYVPEMTWNETCATPFLFSFLGFSMVTKPFHNPNPQTFTQCSILLPDSPEFLLAGGGGGFSTAGSRPDWQAEVFGMPPTNSRAVPDISLFSAAGLFGHALLFCNQKASGAPCDWAIDSPDVGGGTSFAAPAWAGVMAVLGQKSGDRQGIANYRLYQLGLQAFGPAGGPANPLLPACNATLGNEVNGGCLFHSVTTGNIRQGCWTERYIYYDNNLNDAIDCYYGYKQWKNAHVQPLTAYNANGMMSLSSFKRTDFQPGYFDATLGYSVATGLGSPNIANLFAAW